MTTAVNDTGAAKAPWHFWLVGVIGLIWNAFGGYDYLMTQVKGDAYMQGAGMNAAQIAALHAMPAWAVGAWALGVWGSVAGSVLLLGRSQFAVHAFGVSMAGVAASLAYTHLLSDAGKLMGASGALMNAVIAGAVLFQLWYAWTMAKRGFLR
ncbi:hypothetical protein [Phenylobacterium soli]|uniref:Sugar transporter n=1 Tax=Phenylobacterium soli TaxID=2170551 RepID=A0A328AM90_9CAUL|nr:hypothetical protein [Phenylobacterium soli]RAK55106.1 hypothetical protein DJ017_11530 [Phenylobacterium soli]